MCGDCPQPRLLPWCVPAAVGYLECRTLWNYAPSGIPTGLRATDAMTRLRAYARRHGYGRAWVDRAFVGVGHIEAAMVAAAVESARERRAGHE